MCLPVKPYKVEREWKHAGLSCAVTQNREAGNRCGYVRVPPGHPLHGKEYCDAEVSVHGGLTFAELEPCNEHEDGQGWWFGFDCAHAGDAYVDPNAKIETLSSEAAEHVKMLQRYDLYSRLHEHFWTEDEVVTETEDLARQLAVIEVSLPK